MNHVFLMYANRVIGIVGLGMWGEKLVRVGTDLGLTIHGFDTRALRASEVQHRYPSVTLYPSFEALLKNENILSTVIATPPATHFTLAKKALLSGKHLLVEKPMTQGVREARILTELATHLRRVLMVDHTYTFSPALQAAKRLVERGAIGTLLNIESLRLGDRGTTDTTLMWDLAPHDAAIAYFLFEREPLWVCTPKNTKRSVTIELAFPHAVLYRARLSWVSNVRKRTLTIQGTSGSLSISWNGKNETLIKRHDRRSIPIKTPQKEPLAQVIRAFISRTSDSLPVSKNDSEGYITVRIVDALNRSGKQNGRKIHL